MTFVYLPVICFIKFVTCLIFIIPDKITMFVIWIVILTLSCISSTSSFHYGTNPVNQCNFSTAASQQLVVSLFSYLILFTSHLIISAVTDTVGLRHSLIFFCAVRQDSFYPFLSISTSIRDILSSTLKWCQTAPNVTLTRVCTYLHTTYTCTPTYNTCTYFIIGLTPAQAIRESLCSPIENLATIIGRVGAAFNELLKKIGFWTCETKTNCFTHFSQTITFQAKVFQGKFSTMTIFILCKLCVNLWTFCIFDLTNVVDWL